MTSIEYGTNNIQLVLMDHTGQKSQYCRKTNFQTFYIIFEGLCKYNINIYIYIHVQYL